MPFDSGLKGGLMKPWIELVDGIREQHNSGCLGSVFSSLLHLTSIPLKLRENFPLIRKQRNNWRRWAKPLPLIKITQEETACYKTKLLTLLRRISILLIR